MDFDIRGVGLQCCGVGTVRRPNLRRNYQWHGNDDSSDDNAVVGRLERVNSHSPRQDILVPYLDLEKVPPLFLRPMGRSRGEELLQRPKVVPLFAAVSVPLPLLIALWTQQHPRYSHSSFVKIIPGLAQSWAEEPPPWLPNGFSDFTTDVISSMNLCILNEPPHLGLFPFGAKILSNLL